MYKKNDSAQYSPVSVFSKGLFDKISASSLIPVFDTRVLLHHHSLDRVKNWKTMRWQGSQVNSNNASSFDILGIDKNGDDSLFYTLNKNQKEQNISNIPAADYPYVRLRMHTQDTITDIPFQLTDWLVSATPVPEGAVAPNLGVQIPPTVKYDHAVNMQYDTLADMLSSKI
jgi:hypothetical protein